MLSLTFSSFCLSWEQFQSARIGGFLLQDPVAMVVSALVIYLWVNQFGFLSSRNFIDQRTSRKLLHITAGPVFLMTWPLFSSSPEAGYFAAMVPLMNVVRIGANGLGILNDHDFIKSMSRSGKKSELLGGPLCYAALLTVVAAFFWRSSLTSHVAVGIVTGGDGMADVIGRRVGRHKIPYNKNKSIEGSIAFVIAGFLMTVWLLVFFVEFQVLDVEAFSSTFPIQLLLISVACALVESLPLTGIIDDNLTVPAAAIVLCSVFQIS